MLNTEFWQGSAATDLAGSDKSKYQLPCSLFMNILLKSEIVIKIGPYSVLQIKRPTFDSLLFSLRMNSTSTSS